MTYDIQTIANLVGGALILSYFIWQVILKIVKKLLGSGLQLKKKEKKESGSKENEFEEFQRS